jgi:hypothetical protein
MNDESCTYRQASVDWRDTLQAQAAKAENWAWAATGLQKEVFLFDQPSEDL